MIEPIGDAIAAEEAVFLNRLQFIFVMQVDYSEETRGGNDRDSVCVFYLCKYSE